MAPFLRRAAITLVLVLALVAPASAAAAGGLVPVAPSVKPAGFWLTAGQATARARATGHGRDLLARGGVTTSAAAPDLGQWIVLFKRGGRTVGAVSLEDRTGRQLELSPYAWPPVKGRATPAKKRMELYLAALATLFALLLLDLRRLRSWRTLDVAVLTAGFGAVFVLNDRGHVLTAFPLAFALVAYLAARLVRGGLRGAAGRTRWSPPPIALLAPLLGALVAWRTGYVLMHHAVGDVGYASEFGADSILHGYPLYTIDTNHLDTYGPVNYLAYVPATLLFPMAHGWVHDGMTAARVTTIAADLGTTALLFVLGRRVRPGRAGIQAGLGLATLYAACPWTFLPMAAGTNDTLLALFLVAAIIVLASPPWRGAMVGLAAAAKISPLALLPLIAAGGRPDRRRTIVAGLACAGVIALSVVATLPPGGLNVVWHETIGFQLHRRAFQSLWGQHPGLAPLQTALKLAVVAFAAWLAIRPRRRDLAQVAALAAAVLAGLQLVVQYWSPFYLAWIAPLVIVALVLREEGFDPEPSTDEVGESRAQMSL